MILRDLPVVASWSGGKDSCLALWRAVQAGARPQALLTMLDETGERSRSHGARPEVLALQADALGLPQRLGRASWNDYREVFVERLRAAAADGARAVVFGDIDLAAHREWEEGVCAEAGLEAILPLWQQARADLVREFVAAGFVARIVMVNAALADEKWLGRIVDARLIAEMLAEGVDPCGEAGEFHTLVVDGPLFARPLALRDGAVAHLGDYRALDLLPA
ncbi:diphthine--ammonia ligase [Chromobacterium subtsugae]|uniref:Diphthine--ammonia ligase n=1 Tax=Chromobacterium subtsugae TaxID=251747 RepID=A0ABS7FEQ3_9NEIS|nr:MULTISPECIES: diphthine--ammonia ligase [Chromobacterium]KUM05236.1 adenosine nucleotide hydrolase [Chromobacterium subtsugae]KZE87693.1 adenosine nucleotide hydrolase [Chromobacterium sp. F49]MBW7568302.1 diphthine--ammonia ligase [Chromobacterium subtsugae]MBW8288502.1 diphthine--ammonia ligase [Chromobacterium subtsugae]OBU86765.1 adenosine nucleotide hydrolase [Chromobacterium subtsugae]